MPEGPEVTIITRSLNKLVKNKTLIKVRILQGGKYENKAPNNFLLFKENLPLKVESVKNKGKVMFWTFSNGNVMLNHLKMTGFWSIDKKYKHSALEFIFCENNLRLFYTDVRRFGRVEFGQGISDLKEILDNLGPDVINDTSFTFSVFNKLTQNKKRLNITKFLMEQSIMSGIGNYMKSEILYEARISPYRTVGSLEEKEKKRIYKAILRIGKDSLNWGGMSKSDYRDIDGKKGDFEKLLRVYCKSKDPLGNKIETIKTKDGRTTHWVPELQI